MQAFPDEIDYNIAQYGNVLVYYYQVRELYKDCGYCSKWLLNENNNDAVWHNYRRIVGIVAREIISE